ncbi:MAG: hypothetical protein ACI89L_002649 [Phycisphaerales bacterium]|jgi:hypothetical protein
MALESKWWSTAKKKYKKVPDTGLKKALEKYEKALAAFEKAKPDPETKKGIKALDEVRKTLTEVETVAKKAMKDLDDKKHKKAFDKLYGEISTGITLTPMTKARAYIQECSDEFEERFHVANASSKSEADYEKLRLATDKLRAAPQSLANFTAIDTSLTKLETLAEKVREEASQNIETMKKAVTFTNNQKILASMKKDNTKKQADYQKSLDEAIKRRVDLLVKFKAAKKAVDDTKKFVDTLGPKADAAAGTPAAPKIVGMIDVAIKKMSAQFTPANEEFAPGKTIRGSTDIKAANIHATDKALITPHLTNLININKGLPKVYEQVIKDADELKAKLA